MSGSRTPGGHDIRGPRAEALHPCDAVHTKQIVAVGEDGAGVVNLQPGPEGSIPRDQRPGQGERAPGVRYAPTTTATGGVAGDRALRESDGAPGVR
jgi:hypothetical protein